MYKYITVLLLANSLLLTNIKANTVIDSIGVENYNGSKLVIHQIVKNDTYYSIGRRYNVSPKDIMTFNENKYLQVGVLIKVPTKLPFNERTVAGKVTLPTTTTGEGATKLPATGSAAGGIQGADSNNGTTLIEHAVQPRENLNVIAKKYGTTVNEIKRVNELRSVNLRIGQVLKVPAAAETVESTADVTPVAEVAKKPFEQPRPILAPGSQTTTTPGSQTSPNTGTSPNSGTMPKPVVKSPFPVTDKPAVEEKFVEHTVKSNETIYSIATTYHMTMEQLKVKNNLKNNSLYLGQKLLISGHAPLNNQGIGTDSLDENDSNIKDPALRGGASRYGLNQIDEKGTAAWITDQDLDPVKMLVLHRSAPVGAIVKVTNPMTNRSAFAKVVGKFTENESTKDVIIVMTKAVADSIGAIDKRFFCNITYSGQENEQQQ
jgi:peptidoglycan endopeptidase LytF